MARLIEKKLKRMAIGTNVSISYDEGGANKSVSGTITDNDNESCIEVSTEDGRSLLLDYGIVRSINTKAYSLAERLAQLTAGTWAELTFGGQNAPAVTVKGIITDNDHQEALELRTEGGREYVIDYSEVRSFQLVKAEEEKKPTATAVIRNVSRPAPVPTPIPTPPAPVPEPKTDFRLINGDGTLKLLINRMPKTEKKRLSGAYDSFIYGVKNRDHAKMNQAATAAKGIFYDWQRRGNSWSGDAARFCGLILSRVNQYEPDIFLAGHCFLEAAQSSFLLRKYPQAGAYTMLALLEDDEYANELFKILEECILRCNDSSVIPVLRTHGRYTKQIADLTRHLLTGRDASGQTPEECERLLQSLFPNTDMLRYAEKWLPDTSSPSAQKDEPQPATVYGRISKLLWVNETGTIQCTNGSPYSFRYRDISDAGLENLLRACQNSNLNGVTYWVSFIPNGNTAVDIRRGEPALIRARNAAKENRVSDALRLYTSAMETADAPKAISELVEFAVEQYKSNGPDILSDVEALYCTYQDVYPDQAKQQAYLSQVYFYLNDYDRALALSEHSLTFPKLPAKLMTTFLSQHIRYCMCAYERDGNQRYLLDLLQRANEWIGIYCQESPAEAHTYRVHYLRIVERRFQAECYLDMLPEAEADLRILVQNAPASPIIPTMTNLLEETRRRVKASSMPAAVEEVSAAEQTDPTDDPSSADEPDASDEPDEPDDDSDLSDESDADAADEPEAARYQDQEGWRALGLSKKDVVDYALNIHGPGRLAGLLAYLHAGAQLQPDITPVCQMAALAVNDPIDPPDYDVASLLISLEKMDPDYPVFCDCCMGAAFLRASFLSGKGYDYNAQSLRDNISVIRRFPALSSACDIMEEFRGLTGHAIDIYADYRNHGVRELEEELDQVVQQARELYLKFILTPPREGVKFARLLETKKIVFARDGYLAEMLQHVINQDRDALDAEAESFANAYLNGSQQFSVSHTSIDQIDALISESWMQAGRQLRHKHLSADLQGNRRNNLRSNITDVLHVICQWYALSEQSAGLTWRTELGENAYRRLSPRLTEQLEALIRCCDERAVTSPEEKMGLYLLSVTARELIERLDGSWKFETARYLYVDFLNNDYICLNENFLPELSSTFCALPDFNVLARIRHHVETPGLDFQTHLNQIYGMENTQNNYGTAARILEYLRFLGQEDSVTLPNDPDQFLRQTEMQIDMQLRSFQERCALAMNCGQIIQSDAFCYTLGDTVLYWYYFCRQSKNYGFFTSILQASETQIHISAHQYEEQLSKQLDALIASNQQAFEQHPEYETAIRDQITQQNFLVAEDWMHQAPSGSFSIELEQPEALQYLDRFLSSYAAIFGRVADTHCSLSTLLGRRSVHNKDTRGGQQLIDCWLSSGGNNTDRVSRLLPLLGWNNIKVEPYQFSGDSKTELYRVTKTVHLTGPIHPPHPIAAFGSSIERDGMFTVCLYGIYDCDRLMEKIGQLDALDGNKIILLDYALTSTDRRSLARKLKKRDSGLRNVYLIIDRVLITFLADNYNSNLISRILMAAGMPFSYCQPYVVESSHTMPPEIFIGRKDELLRIERPDGVNLIFGGRQLGKSALFKKARADIDGDQLRRAVLVDIKDCDCASAAKKLSEELIDLEILPADKVTNDWDVLCRSIKQRLRRTNDPIRYLLVMLDEADAFVDDCAHCNYRPLVALKDVQQTLPGTFKFVLAGLHNIVRFNREVALGKNAVITHLPYLKITPFQSPDDENLLTIPLSYLGFSLPNRVIVSQILATTNRFPGLIQLYCQKLIESIRAADYAGYDIRKTPPYVITDEHLRRVMADKEFIEQIREKFEITLRLDQDQGSYYYPMALLIGWMYTIDRARSQKGYAAADVLRCAKDLHIYPLANLNEEKIEALMQELQDLNILRSVSHNTYLLASKNFRDLLGSDEEIFDKLDALSHNGGDAE